MISYINNQYQYQYYLIIRIKNINFIAVKTHNIQRCIILKPLIWLLALLQSGASKHTNQRSFFRCRHRHSIPRRHRKKKVLSFCPSLSLMRYVFFSLSFSYDQMHCQLQSMCVIEFVFVSLMVSCVMGFCMFSHFAPFS